MSTVTLTLVFAAGVQGIPTLPRWEVSHDTAYNSDPFGVREFYDQYYYSDYSYQEEMQDPATGQFFDCRSNPLLCYELARVPKKMVNPTKSTSAIFAQISNTVSPTAPHWPSPSIPSIVIEWGDEGHKIQISASGIAGIVIGAVFAVLIFGLWLSKLVRPNPNQPRVRQQNFPMLEMPTTNREETLQPIVIQNERFEEVDSSSSDNIESGTDTSTELGSPTIRLSESISSNDLENRLLALRGLDLASPNESIYCTPSAPHPDRIEPEIANDQDADSNSSLTEISTRSPERQGFDGSGSIQVSIESEPTIQESQFGPEVRTNTPPRPDMEPQESATPVNRILASTSKKLTNIKRKFKNAFKSDSDEEKESRKNLKKDSENPDDKPTSKAPTAGGPIRIRQSARTRERPRPDYSRGGEGRRPSKKTQRKPKNKKSQ